MYYLHDQQNFLALPEVVEREVEKNLNKRAEESAGMIDQGWRFLERITGRRPEFRPPSEGERQIALTRRLEEMQALIVRVPLRIDHVRSALDRVNDETPPNGPNNQQYKDSLIWEAVPELAMSHRVKLVTADKGFYEGRDPKKGLALNLNGEAQATAGGVQAHSGIQDCLKSLRIGTPPLNTQLLAERLDPVVQPILEPGARARGFQLGPRSKHEIEIYATEQLDRVALGFKLTYSLVDERKCEIPAREEASVMTSGTCFLSKATDAISELVLNGASFSWSDTEGNRHQSANVYLRTRMGSGSNMVPYAVRGPV